MDAVGYFKRGLVRRVDPVFQRDDGARWRVGERLDDDGVGEARGNDDALGVRPGREVEGEDGRTRGHRGGGGEGGGDGGVRLAGGPHPKGQRGGR